MLPGCFSLLVAALISRKVSLNLCLLEWHRSLGRAEELARSLGNDAEAVSLEDVASGQVSGDVLLNTTSVGMQPKAEESPLPASALPAYRLVFDAVYVPMETRLLSVSSLSITLHRVEVSQLSGTKRAYWQT